MKSADFRSMVKVTPTRFVSDDVRLYIGKIGPSLWQVVVEQGGDMSQTGQQTKTKMEAFSVLPQVAQSWGFTI